MPGSKPVWTWLVAHVQTLLHDDWKGAPGEDFREGTQAISQYAEKLGLLPHNVDTQDVDLNTRKLIGSQKKELAETEKYVEAALAFTEDEKNRIKTELSRRSLESEVQRREAMARAADLAEPWH